jgi:hypothetical protein
MSSAAPAPLPLFHEGSDYWENLGRECRRLMDSINAAALNHGLPADYLVEWAPGSQIRLVRHRCPSTEVTLSISFERWGPTIHGTVTGHEEEDLRFYPEELEVPLARDPDDEGVIAVLGEGRSLSAREFACFLAQNFRRCFPGMALPCTPV